MNLHIKQLALTGASLLVALGIGAGLKSNHANASMIYEDQYPSHFNRLIPGGEASHSFYKNGYLFHAKHVLDSPGAITGIDNDYHVSKGQVERALEGKRIFKPRVRKIKRVRKVHHHYYHHIKQVKRYPNWLSHRYWLYESNKLTVGNIYNNSEFKRHHHPNYKHGIYTHIKYLSNNKVIVSYIGSGYHHHNVVILKQYIKRLPKSRIYVKVLSHAHAKNKHDGTGVYYSVSKRLFQQETHQSKK